MIQTDRGKNILLAILILISLQISTGAERCSKPTISRKKIFIYRSIGNVTVSVYRCVNNNSGTANSDISDQCLSAFQTGKNQRGISSLYNGTSPKVLEEYTAKADPLMNQIWLRSGTVCRYDRGFCYDSNETVSFPVVWEIIPIPEKKCPDDPDDIVQVFYGYVDFWSFDRENLLYIFYHQLVDGAFSLRLESMTECNKQEVWFSGDRNYLVSQYSITVDYRPPKKMNEPYFHLKPKKEISEEILKDCDIRAHKIDFDNQIMSDYLADPENLRNILKLYQNFINSNRKLIKEVSANYRKLRASIATKNKDIKNIKMILDQHQGYMDKLNESLSADTSQIKENGTDDDIHNKIESTNEVVTKIITNITQFGINLGSISQSLGKLEGKLLTFKDELHEDISKIARNISSTIQLDNFNKTLSSATEELNNTVTKYINNAIENILEKFNATKASMKELTKDISDQFGKKYNDLLDIIDDRNDDAITNINNNLTLIDDAIKDLTDKSDDYKKEIDSLNKSLEDIEKNSTLRDDAIKKLTSLQNKNDFTSELLKNELKELKNNLEITDQNLSDIISNKTDQYTKQIDVLKTKTDFTNELMKNELEEVKNNLEILDMNMSNTINNNSDQFLKRINVLKTKNEFTDELLRNEIEKVKNDLVITDRNLLHVIDNKTNQFVKQIDVLKNKTEFTNELLRNAIEELKSNLEITDQKQGEMPSKIEDMILRRINFTLTNMTATCGEEVLKLNNEIISRLEVINNTLNEKINDLNSNISHTITNFDSELEDSKNKVSILRKIVDENGEFLDEEFEEIKRNMSSISDTMKNTSHVIDQKMRGKYDDLLDIINNRSDEYMKEMDYLQNKIKGSVNEITSKINKTLNVNREIISQIVRNVTNNSETIKDLIKAADENSKEIETLQIDLSSTKNVVFITNRTIGELVTKVDANNDALVEKINAVNSTILNKMTISDSKIKGVDNKLDILKKIVNENERLSRKGFEETKKNISSILDSMKNISGDVNNKIRDKYAELLDIVNNRSDEYMKEMDFFQNKIEGSLNGITNSINNTVNATRKAINQIFGNVTDNYEKLSTLIDINGDLLHGLQKQVADDKAKMSIRDSGYFLYLNRSLKKNDDNLERLNQGFVNLNQSVSKINNEVNNITEIINQVVVDIAEDHDKVQSLEEKSDRNSKNIEILQDGLFSTNTQLRHTNATINDIIMSVADVREQSKKVANDTNKRVNEIIVNVDKNRNEIIILEKNSNRIIKDIDDIKTFNSNSRELFNQTIDDVGAGIKRVKEDVLRELSVINQSIVLKMEELNASFVQNIQPLQTEIKTLGGEATIQKTKTEQILRVIKSMGANINKTVDDIDENKQFLQNLRKQIADTEARMSNRDVGYFLYLNQSLKQNGHNLSALKKDIHSLNQSILVLNDTSRELNESFVEVTKKTDKNTEDIGALKTESDNTRKLLNRHGNEIQILRNGMIMLEKKFAKNTTVIGDLKLESDNSKKLLNEQQREIRTIHSRLSSTDTQLFSTNQGIEELRAQIADLKNTNENREKHFAETIADIQHTIRDKNAEIAELKMHANNSKQCCMENQKKLQEKDEEINKLRREFRVAMRKLTENYEQIKKDVYHPNEPPVA